jgi:hypothetical protein
MQNETRCFTAKCCQLTVAPVLNGGKYVIRCQRPPDALERELANGFDCQRGPKAAVGKVRAQNSPLAQIKRRARKADRSARTFLRLITAPLLPGLSTGILVHFHLAACFARHTQGGYLAAVLPDGMIDFGLEAQFGEMSPNRYLAILRQPNPANIHNCAGDSIRVHETARAATSKATLD